MNNVIGIGERSLAKFDINDMIKFYAQSTNNKNLLNLTSNKNGNLKILVPELNIYGLNTLDKFSILNSVDK